VSALHKPILRALHQSALYRIAIPALRFAIGRATLEMLTCSLRTGMVGFAGPLILDPPTHFAETRCRTVG
jgi:hypothetical protein